MSDRLNVKNAIAGDRELDTKTAYFELGIVGNATPASKSHSTSHPGSAYLRTEGKTAEADGVESGISYTAAVDDSTGDSVFGVLLKADELSNAEFSKVLEISIAESPNQSADLATGLAVTPIGGDYKTAGGNIAMDIAGTGLDLSAESPNLVLKVVYLVR